MLGPEIAPTFFATAARIFAGSVPALDNVKSNFRRFGLPPTAARPAMDSFARYLGEFFSVAGDPRRMRRIVTATNLESIRAAQAEQRGVLAVTAHFGNWEFGALAIGESFPDVAVLIRTTGDRIVDEHIRACRGKNQLLNVADGLRGALRVLERGGIVCAAIDEPREEGIEVEFCSGRMYFPAPLFRMAERTGAVIVPVKCARDGQGHVSVETFPPAPDAAEVARIFSEWITRDPSQWVMLGRVTAP